MAPRPIITLTTDYGTNDHLVGTLKGVILKINPDVTIVDISHDVTPYDLLDGALTIGSSYSYFPPRTIHVVVVDPGVGTERRPLLVTGDTQYFVAPDNGVLSLVYEREENILVRHANVEHYYLQPVSKTFHGRDVFAPVAAWLAKGSQASAMGEEITDYKKFAMPKPKAADGVSKGVVLRVDSFGNLITNFRPEDLPAAAIENGTVQLTVGTQSITKLVDTFRERKSRRTVRLHRLQRIHRNRNQSWKHLEKSRHRPRHAGHARHCVSFLRCEFSEIICRIRERPFASAYADRASHAMHASQI